MNLKEFSYCEAAVIKAWFACNPQVQIDQMKKKKEHLGEIPAPTAP